MPDISDTVNKVEQEQQAKAGNSESPLEKKAKRGFFRKIVDFGYMTLTTAGALAVAGPLNLVSVTGTFLLAHAILNRKKLTYEGLRKEMHLGNAMTVALYYFFRAYNAVTPGNLLLNSLFILGVGIPAFNALFIPTKYMLYNYTPLKLLKDTLTFKLGKTAKNIKEIFKKDYIKTTLRTYLLAPIVIAAINFVPFKYQLPATSVGRFFYRLALGKGGKGEKDSYKPPATYKPATQPA